MSDTKEGFDAKNAYTSTWEDVDIVESDVELDVTDVVGPDHDPPQKVGDIKTWCGCLLLVFVFFIFPWSICWFFKFVDLHNI